MSQPMLGPFRLERPIGAGGQGTVWRAVHATTGTPVGIKVLSSLRARDDAALAGFRREVRAAAGLDHPGVIMVLDQGRVPAGLDGHMGLAAGSPWLAMELARTSLDAQPGPYPWGETRALLGALLDALGHAHARGLVHRDMKPANVLFMEAPRGAAGLSQAKIADFGLAFGRDDALDPTRRAMAGTPLYMAPEQFRGELADLGPWSDIYAMGWMAWELVTGHHPLAGLEIIDIRAQKTMGRLPALAADAAAPTGFEAWLRRMLHLDPRQRYQWTADARAALYALPDDAPEPALPIFGGLDRNPTTAGMSGSFGGGTVPSSERTWDAELTTEELTPVSWQAGAPLEEAEAAPIEPAPLPDDWRTRAREFRPSLQGAGLGLFGQRTLPLLGRDEACTALWQALRDTATTGRPVTVLLHGPAGAGTTRLAEWLVERAEEQAGVDSLRLDADPQGAHDGLDAMLSRRFGIAALPDADARARLLRALYALGLTDPVDHRPLLEMLGLEAQPVANGAERHAALRALLQRLTHQRPLIVHIDDAAASTEGLRFVRSIVERASLPVLVVMCARDENLAEDASRADAVAALDPRRIAVPGLSPTHQRALVRSALHIDDDLLGALVARTEGNPGFTRQLLTDWVDRALFEPHPTGLRLQRGMVPPLPDGVYAAWNGRISRIEDMLGEDALAALEMASLLEGEIDTRTWSEAAARRNGTDAAALLESLFEQALAQPGADPDHTWRFTHSVFRECLQRHAADRGVDGALHSLLAQVLAARDATAGDIGHHQFRAGEYAEALPRLIDGVRAANEADASALSHRLLREADEAVEHLGLGDAHPMRIQLGLQRARQAVIGGHFSDAESILHDLQAGAGPDFPDAARCGLLAGLTMAALGPMHLDKARERAGALLTAATAVEDAEQIARAHVVLAQTATWTGQWEEAQERWQHAAERSSEDLPADLMAQIAFGPIQLAVSRGDLDAARALCGPAIAYLESTGQRRRLGQVQNTRGDILRKQGDLTGAAEAYRAAERTFEVLSSAYGTAPRINLGLTLLAAEDFEAAGVALRRALGDVRAEGHAGYEYAVRHALLPVAAARRDRDRTDEHLEAIAALRSRGHFLDGDLATTAEQAGDLWHRGWDADLARSCWDLAHAQWSGLGDGEATARTERKRSRGRRSPPGLITR